jgi:DNA-binding Xre family transcriptional regulator
MLIRVSLDRYLERHNLSAYRLANELKGRVAQGSVYAMTRSKTVKRIDLETLSGVLQALERITGEPVTPNDLLEVVQESEPDPEQAWLDSSAADLKAALEEIEANENPNDVTAWVNAFEAVAR